VTKGKGERGRKEDAFADSIRVHCLFGRLVTLCEIVTIQCFTVSHQ
jgi:hypothetical protein